jgi:mono/diheme cytochrome c family protein
VKRNVVALILGLAACSSSSTPATDTARDGGGGVETSSAATPTGLRIVSGSVAPTLAVAGDAIPLSVVYVMSDGTTSALTSEAAVSWVTPATVAALDPSSAAPSPLPAPGAQPTAVFIQNPGRPDRSGDLPGVLFVLDPGTSPNGTVSVDAIVSGGPFSGSATASITVGGSLTGDPTRGAMLYGATGLNCARCHGATAEGSPPDDDGGAMFTIAGQDYSFPAPGLDAESGNLGSDPAWNAPLLAMASRADMDNGGLTLRSPMVDWLATASPATGQPPTTQDFTDIYAFLKTQNAQ